MTEEQVQEILDFAKARIAGWMEKIRPRLGWGFNEFQRLNTTVVSLQEKHRYPPPQAMEDYWSVTFYGYFTSNFYSRFDYPPPVGTVTTENSTVSEEGVILFVDSFSPQPNSTNSTIVNRAASNLTFEDPPGSVVTDQTMFIRIQNYQFPVRLELQVQLFDNNGNPAGVSTNTLTFVSGAQQSYRIEQLEPGSRLVTAVAVTRL